ncbi:hypothetical protein AMECASPLE_015181 [Ameca splendens]|uniref:Uncharacterized protein n=1 Tax=Ameca splendens TaxID=208324 RepID=A0ABV0ZXM0_9TELE
MNRLTFQFQRGWRMNRLHLQSPKGFAADLLGSAADLQGLVAGSSGFCIYLLSYTANLSMTGLLTACSEGPLLWWAVCLNSGSRRVDLQVTRLNFVVFLAPVLFG